MSVSIRSESHRTRNLMIAILLFFSVLSVARLNQIYFFSPDSPDYVLMARGLVNDFEYRQIDFPGAPYFTQRPPGMSVLLIPAALVAPYNVIAAKVTVILTALIMLALLYRWMSRLAQSAIENEPELNGTAHWLTLLVMLLLTTNPHFLLFSTIIMSEIPFMAFTVAILYLISNDTAPINKQNLILLTGLLMFLPFIRTIGVALILAIAIWAVVRRQRWPYLISVVCSLATTGLWILRNNSLKTDIYTSSTFDEIRQAGFSSTLLSMINRSLNHFESLCNILFPNMPGRAPRYERFLLDGNHVLPGPQLIYFLACILILSIAIYGMLKLWNKGGAVSLFYILITFGILSVWPWMQPRYTLPLLPVILAFFPVGFLFLLKYVTGSKILVKKSLVGIAMFTGIAILCSQSITDYRLIHANQQLIFQGEQFYQTQLPSTHYSDFVQAGRWIKENTPENARILTRQNDLATTGHRFQKLVYFEQTRPAQLRELIQKFSSRYLVCFDKNAADTFPWHLLDHDLIYRLTPVYSKSGIMIIEVRPNYEGTIRHQYWQKEEMMNVARQTFEKFPNRVSAQVTYLSLLLKTENFHEAISFVEALPEVSDVRIVNFLGWAYIGQREYPKALQEFSKALRMPGQSSISLSIHRGRDLAQKQLTKNTVPASPDKSGEPGRNLQIAKEYWKLSDFDRVLKFTQKVFDANKSSQAELDQAHVLLARLHLIKGETQQAVEELKQVSTTENAEANELRDRIHLEESLSDLLNLPPHQKTEITDGLDPKQQAAIQKLVSIYESEGIPGKALRLLEQAHMKTPLNEKILKLLAKFQLFYNLVPEAEVSYLTLQEMNPDDQEVAAALEKIETLKKTPHF
ncbi:tetratricopeptide repeat protein [Gimesia alba]|nr:tetratricopeptide repeat protein [Gimesia alba]